MLCNNCGAQNSDGKKFCTYCGASLAVEPIQSPKSGNKKLIIAIASGAAALLIIGIIVACIFIFGGDKNKNDDRGKRTKPKTEEITNDNAKNSEPATEKATNPQQEEASFYVENFAGQPYEYIVQVQQKRFKITTVWEYSNTVEKGKIISQSIQPGTTVKRGTELTLVISNGIEYITIPQDLIGKSVEEAKQKLLDAGFVVSIRYETNDGTQIPDTVIGVSPQSGTSHPRNGEIELTAWDELSEPESSTNWIDLFD